MAVASTARPRSGAGLVLALLYVGYLLSFGDRVIFGLVLKPIKATFGFSDTQLGLLSGAAFALSYALFSPLGGWLADRVRRTPLFAGAVTLWSAATLATGLAASFATLAFARVGVGVGESVLNPLAMSLVADTRAPAARARGYSIYFSAGAVGAFVALLFGGLLVQSFVRSGGAELPLLGRVAPWRALFVWAALPGFVLAAVVLLLLREPARTKAAEVEGARTEPTGWGFVRAHPRFAAAVFLGVSLIQMGAYTATTWNVVFFERVHGWSAARTALTLSLTAGIATIAGCLASGPLLGRLRAGGRRDAALALCVGSALLFGVFAAGAYLAPNAGLAVGLLTVASLAGYVPSVCAFSAMAEAVPGPVRARLAGVHTFSNGVISNTLGPLLVGVLNDRVFHGEAGVRYSLATTVVLATTVGAAVVAFGLKDFRRQLSALPQAA